jgi:hypothetical protein
VPCPCVCSFYNMHTQLVLATEHARTATKAILECHCIASDRSPDLSGEEAAAAAANGHALAAEAAAKAAASKAAAEAAKAGGSKAGAGSHDPGPSGKSGGGSRRQRG